MGMKFDEYKSFCSKKKKKCIALYQREILLRRAGLGNCTLPVKTQETFKIYSRIFNSRQAW